MLYELVTIADSIVLTDGDAISVTVTIKKNTMYSLYAVISFRGLLPLYTPVVWKIMVHPLVNVYLWFLANKRLLTRDKLAIRQKWKICPVFSGLRMRKYFLNVVWQS